MSGTLLKVVVLQRRLVRYRVPLFEKMRALCRERDIDLHLVHGEPSAAERSRGDDGSVPWAHRVTGPRLRVGGKELSWQPLPRLLKDASLFVLSQESAIISNYPLLFMRRRRTRVAYWGHGKNLQTTAPRGLRERWKQLLINRVDWWFAYTALTVGTLKRNGFPDASITCLDNALDTQAFKRELSAVDDSMLRDTRARLGIDADATIGLFCGSLYADKRLELLIAAADIVRAKGPNFHVIVIGDGPNAALLREAAAQRPWLHCVGTQWGQYKAILFRLAKTVLNPGAVGLNILDAFCAGLPMITTNTAKHGPEIVYLQHRVNGIAAGDTPAEFASAIGEMLQDGASYDAYSAAARATADRYTVDNMAANFVDGIVRAVAVTR